MRFLIIISSLISIYTAGFSQGNSSCATSEAHKSWIENDLNYKMKFEQAQRTNAVTEDTGQVFTIPLVFHVIHLGEPVGNGSNISEENILSAIQRLNDDFSFSNSLNLDIGIKFCLAKVDPNGRPTNGIDRVDGQNIPYYAANGISYGLSEGLNEAIIKSTTGWPNTRYYNVWVVHDIVGGWGGYAYYPTTSFIDGTVILDYLVKGNYSTLTHELGHGFDLRHTFEGDLDNTICPVNGNCNNNGDLICDTPPHKKDDCGNTNPCSNEGIWEYSRYNVMSYCSNRDVFTPDQLERMRNAANRYPRSELSISSNYVCSDSIMLDAELTSINAPDQNYPVEQCGNSIIGNFTVTNKGQIPITRFSIDYSLNNELYSKGYFTNLVPGESRNFTLPTLYVGASNDNQLGITITSVNETVDDYLDNNSKLINFNFNDTCTTTSLYNYYLSKIKMFPTFGRVETLKFRDLPNETIISINVFDTKGALVINRNVNQSGIDLDISALEKGFYFVTLEIQGVTLCKKLVLQ